MYYCQLRGKRERQRGAERQRGGGKEVEVEVEVEVERESRQEAHRTRAACGGQLEGTDERVQSS